MAIGCLRIDVSVRDGMLEYLVLFLVLGAALMGIGLRLRRRGRSGRR